VGGVVLGKSGLARIGWRRAASLERLCLHDDTGAVNDVGAGYLSIEYLCVQTGADVNGWICPFSTCLSER